LFSAKSAVVFAAVGQSLGGTSSREECSEAVFVLGPRQPDLCSGAGLVWGISFLFFKPTYICVRKKGQEIFENAFVLAPKFLGSVTFCSGKEWKVILVMPTSIQTTCMPLSVRIALAWGGKLDGAEPAVPIAAYEIRVASGGPLFNDTCRVPYVPMSRITWKNEKCDPAVFTKRVAEDGDEEMKPYAVFLSG
jgi:hypothetical protein